MESKKFFILFVAFLVIISLLTSYVTFLYLNGFGSIHGRATEGSLTIGGLDSGTTVNVIVVDSTVADVTNDPRVTANTVTFPSAVRGQAYKTQATNGLIYPFLIRNTGTVQAYVTLYVTNSKTGTYEGDPFDQNPTTNPTDPSMTYFWVQSAAPITGAIGNWNLVDNCGTNCFKTADNLYPGDGGTCASGCLNLRNVMGSVNALKIIGDTAGATKGLQYLDKRYNEAFLHVRVSVSNGEGTGAKSTTIRITGYEAV